LKRFVPVGERGGIRNVFGNRGYIDEDAISNIIRNQRYLKVFEKRLLNPFEDGDDDMGRFEYKIADTDRYRNKNRLLITRILKRFIKHGFRHRAENYIINSSFMFRVYFGCKDVFFNPNKNLSYSRPHAYPYEKPPKKHLRKLKLDLTVAKSMLSEQKRISHCSRLVHAAIRRKQHLYRRNLKTAIFLESYKTVIRPESSLTFKNPIGLSLEQSKFRVNKYVKESI
jgi:hypothetical protein